MQWDPTQYLKSGFDALRLRPGLDLIGAISHENPTNIVDLGCGTATLTNLLAARWPDAQISGLDRSADMLATARDGYPELALMNADVESWRAETPLDVIYSNAALQWLDEHSELFPRLLSMLNPGGTLAVQMPRNHSAPSHTAMAESVLAGPWQADLEPLLRPGPVGSPDFYYDILAPISSSLNLWETEYLQILEGPDPVKE